jgi:hypothetical protein
MSFIEENIQDAYKWRLFSLIKSNGIFKDIILYASQQSGDNLDDILKYTNDQYLRDENFDRITDENDDPILTN